MSSSKPFLVLFRRLFLSCHCWHVDEYVYRCVWFASEAKNQAWRTKWPTNLGGKCSPLVTQRLGASSSCCHKARHMYTLCSSKLTSKWRDVMWWRHTRNNKPELSCLIWSGKKKLALQKTQLLLEAYRTVPENMGVIPDGESVTSTAYIPRPAYPLWRWWWCRCWFGCGGWCAGWWFSHPIMCGCSSLSYMYILQSWVLLQL